MKKKIKTYKFKMKPTYSKVTLDEFEYTCVIVPIVPSVTPGLENYVTYPKWIFYAINCFTVLNQVLAL